MKPIISPIPSDALMWDAWMSRYQLSVLTVADEIGLFQQLQDSTLTTDEIANNLTLTNRAIEILVKILLTLGFLIEKNNKFALTPTAKAYLLPASPFYWETQLEGLRARPEHEQIINAIKNNAGQLAHNGKTFTDMWETSTITAEAAHNFTKKMHENIFAPALSAVKTGVFKSTKKLLDIGGGAESFSIAYIQQYPHYTATVFDLPEVCIETNKYLNASNVTKKVFLQPGNFFKDRWPSDHDGILFSQIFHDWPPEQCKILARNAHDALPVGGQIFIHEMLLDNNKASPLTVAFFDLLMFINHRSQQYTKLSIRELLSEVGFKNINVKQTFGYHSITIAKK